MGFEDLLKRRLGPMWSIREDRQAAGPAPDPSRVWYRRAAGLELSLRADRGWDAVELRGAGGKWQPLSRQEGAMIAGLTSWRSPGEIGASAAELWKNVERDLLFYARKPPRGRHTGQAGVLAAAGAKPIALRRSMWPTLAVENAVEIAPIPFMPRGRELEGVELVGLRFGSHERGHEVFGLSITGSVELGATLRRLVPRLDGTRSAEEVRAGLGLDGERLLSLLDQMTALEVAEPSELRQRLMDAPSPSATWLGHAGVLLVVEGRRILVDPLFFSASEPTEAWLSEPKFDPRALPPIDLVLITHGDNDHLNPSSLLYVDPNTPIAIPRHDRWVEPYQVDLRGVLRVLGFTRVIELDDWEHLDLGSIRVTATPFQGEDWGLPLAQATYLVEAPSFSAFFSADSLRMDETYQWLAKRQRRVDLAFLGISGSAESMAMPKELGYGNFYEDFIPLVARNEWVQHCAGPSEAAENAAIFRPRCAFGYAAGGASYIQTSYGDVGTHAEFAALLEAQRKAEDDPRPVELRIGVPFSPT
ncbi:MAG: MBL fold metallo-hydrolase [Myxococcota bacterium]